jgi:hypothetical protein
LAGGGRFANRNDGKNAQKPPFHAFTRLAEAAASAPLQAIQFGQSKQPALSSVLISM